MGILEKLKINKKVKAEVKSDVKSEETKKDKIENKTAVTVKKTKGSKLYHRILLHPLVTEKSAFQEGKNKYSFIVEVSSNKGEIRRSIEEAYGVKPLSVITMNVEGKKKRYGRFNGCRNAYKKAVVTMPKGKTINIHEGV